MDLELPIRHSPATSLGEPSAPANEENEQPSQQNEIPARQLSPVDGGLPAWTVLITGFIFEALLWGQSNPGPSFQAATLAPEGSLL